MVAKENLSAFISLAQDQLTAFADGGAWNDLKWSNGRTTVIFCKYRPRSQVRKRPVPLDEPFLSFAKAFVRYQYSHKPTKTVSRMISAIRMIELALLHATGRADILDLSVPVLDLSTRFCAEHNSSKQCQYQVGHHIEALADFCREQALVPALPSWTSPFRKQPTLTESLTEEGARHRESKLPTNHSMLALADIFARADDVESQYFTSIAVLMMVAPSRSSEVLALSVDCIGWEQDSQGQPQMYLRWRAAKGGGPMKKWVPAPMRDVVQEAVARLTRIGTPAREAARFAHDHPDQFMRHPACTTPEDFGEDDELQASQATAAIGVKYHDGHGWGALPPMWAALRSAGAVTYRRLADKVAELYKRNYWPYLDARKEVAAWEALCLFREFEFHRDFSARPFSWRLPTNGQIICRIGGSLRLSLFEQAGLRNPDGTPIQLTTHQLRHWLSTMCARAGMDDYTLARWAGRTRIEDNRHYDHRTQRERSDELRTLLIREEPSTLEKFRGGLPVTYKELGVDRPGVAKATLYGMCVHDYAMTPCLKQRDCMTCKESVCIKGDHVTLDRIKQLEEMTASLLAKARQAAGDSVFGADRWVDHHVWELAHVRTMRTMLESESVQDGAVLRIPAEYDPSPVRRALMDRGLVKTPSSASMLAVEVVPLIEEQADA